MKYFISHRGNINGRIPQKENTIKYINKALELGFDVEIDVWYNNGKYFLGHDVPGEEVDESFLSNERLWCHAKNTLALSMMMKSNSIHCFWHQEDDYTLTSKGFIWVYPNIKCPDNSICVMPNNIELIRDCLGVCSDDIKKIYDRYYII